MVADYESLVRLKNLMSLSDVVLLDGGSVSQTDRSHLEEMLLGRVDKEFGELGGQESNVIDGIKNNNLRFKERTIKRFGDDQQFVQIGTDVREKDVHLFWKFDDKVYNTDALFKMGDALKRAGARSVTLYAPYLVDQRQDKKDDGRVAISARNFFDKLHVSFGYRLKRVVTSDLHAQQIQGFFDGPLDVVSAIPEFAAFYRSQLAEELAIDGQVYVVSPDAGGSRRARKLAELLGVQYVVLDKRRTGHGEAETNFYLPVNLEGKTVILIDDMIDSAGSVAGKYEVEKEGPIQYLRQGGANVYLCATHPIFSEKGGISAEERLRRSGAQVLVSDSFAKDPDYIAANADWLTTISLDYAIAKAFYCSQVGGSFSEFLRGREARMTARKLNIVPSVNGVVRVED